ncbi:MAG: endonuclease [Marmoricola sp.]|nr:endonuclease [Marmoricola sp.]
MTAALHDLRPDADHPVAGGVVEVHRVLDRMQAGATVPLASGEHARVVAELNRAARRLTALKLKVVAAADKAGAPSDAGFAGTESWVARHTTVSRTTAAREVALATQLEAGHDATAAALDEGLVSPAHADVILRAGQQLPDGVSDEQRQQVEQALVEKAKRFDPDQLRRIARRAIEAIEPDEEVVDAHEDEQLRSEEEAARANTRLTFHDNGDGTVTGHFTVPALAAAVLQKVIESMTAPRRMRGHDARRFDWDHRRGLAFAELLEHLPTDHLHAKTAATVVVTISHQVLQDALKAAHLDTGQSISAGDARRLACNAGIIPAVLGTGSVALDLGHESRLFSQAQRIAKGLEHATCAADGCERRYAWCELHHRKPWSLGGRTDLRDAVPLCHWHHQRIHDHAFWHRYLPDGTISFSRRT